VEEGGEDVGEVARVAEVVPPSVPPPPKPGTCVTVALVLSPPDVKAIGKWRGDREAAEMTGKVSPHHRTAESVGIGPHERRRIGGKRPLVLVVPWVQRDGGERLGAG
jgi:hypothetical protein